MNREREQASITAFEKIFHFGRVLWSWKANTYEQREQVTITVKKFHNESLPY